MHGLLGSAGGGGAGGRERRMSIPCKTFVLLNSYRREGNGEKEKKGRGRGREREGEWEVPTLQGLLGSAQFLPGLDELQVQLPVTRVAVRRPLARGHGLQ